jgi:hypothetical protein
VLADSVIQFTGLLGISAIFDTIWMIRNDQSGFIKFLTVVLILFKVTYVESFRDRVDPLTVISDTDFLLLPPRYASTRCSIWWTGWGRHHRYLGSSSSSSLRSNSPSVWSMPGGFTSTGRDGYQTVDDETHNHQPPQPRATPKPVLVNNPAAPGAYESV